MLSEKSTVTLVQPGAWIVNLSGLTSNILHVLDRLRSGRKEVNFHEISDFAESVILTEQSLNCTRLYCSSAETEAPKGTAGARLFPTGKACHPAVDRHTISKL